MSGRTVLVALAAVGFGALQLGGCGSRVADTPAGAADAVTQTPGGQTPGASSSSPAPTPPAWLLEKMRLEVRALDDPQARVWWTKTTAAKAYVVMNGSAGSERVVHPQRSVYVVIIHGEIDGSSFSHPYGATPGPYTWMCELIDAESRSCYALAATNHPFDTSGVETYPVEL